MALMPLPAIAWDFSPDPICTLRHTDVGNSVVVTFDPTTPLYTLSVTLDEGGWSDGAFTIRFLNGSPPQIGTTRQTLSEDGQTLTVTDRGFGNVLDGLGSGVIAEMNVAQSGVTIPLDGIEPALAAFRACPAEVPPLS